MELRSSMVVWGSIAAIAALGCGDDSAGTGGGGGGDATTAATTTAATTTTTTTGGGGEAPTCTGELTFDDETYTTCAAENCCEAVETCTADGTEQQECIDCMFRGSGDPRCNDLINCMQGQDCVAGGATPVCDGEGFAQGTPTQIACVDENCCEAIATCTEDGADPSGCQACVQAGGGARCDDLIACNAECGIAFGPICDSGIGTGNLEFSACLSENCCAEFTDCTGEGTEINSCIECFNSGGEGEQCAAAFECAAQCQGDFVNFCDSGIGIPEPTEDQRTFVECASENCCAEYNACTQDGAETDLCIECLNAGGGDLCDEAITCVAVNECDPQVSWFCDSGIGYFNAPEDIAAVAECVAENCCEEANTCTTNGTDVIACDDCLNDRDGASDICVALDECAREECGSGVILYSICETGLGTPDQELADCASDNCCDEYEACVGDTPEEAQACLDCLQAEGGEECDDVITCMETNCPLGEGGGGGAGGGTGGSGGSGGDTGGAGGA